MPCSVTATTIVSASSMHAISARLARSGRLRAITASSVMSPAMNTTSGGAPGGSLGRDQDDRIVAAAELLEHVPDDRMHAVDDRVGLAGKPCFHAEDPPEM